MTERKHNNEPVYTEEKPALYKYKDGYGAYLITGEAECLHWEKIHLLLKKVITSMDYRVIYEIQDRLQENPFKSAQIIIEKSSSGFEELLEKREIQANGHLKIIPLRWVDTVSELIA
jgi:hypothetical protein